MPAKEAGLALARFSVVENRLVKDFPHYSPKEFTQNGNPSQ
jgi:hypothetical protein